MGGMSKYFGGGLPVGHVKPILLPSNGVNTDPDGSKWLASGAVIPALQADPYLIDTDLRCLKAALDINLPVTITAAARFANTSAVTWIIDAAGAVLYSTDGGATWNNTTPTGGGTISYIIGFRKLSASVEVFAASSAKLFRAVITNAAPDTVAWSEVATISNTSFFNSGASFAFDGTNYLICWPAVSTGQIVSLSSANGTSWTESNVAATDAQNNYKCLVTAKPGGGFRVAVTSGSAGTGANVYSTSTGASFSKVNAVSITIGTALSAAKSLLTYVGSRLFLFAETTAQSGYSLTQVSDDDGVTWGAIGVKLLLPISYIGSYGSGGASYDGTRLAFVSYASNSAYVVSTANGIDFKVTQLFIDSAEISAFSIGHLIGERFVFVPVSSTKNKLFNINNAFTPNSSTDFIGIAARNTPQGANNLVYAARVL